MSPFNRAGSVSRRAALRDLWDRWQFGEIANTLVLLPASVGRVAILIDEDWGPRTNDTGERT